MKRNFLLVLLALALVFTGAVTAFATVIDAPVIKVAGQSLIDEADPVAVTYWVNNADGDGIEPGSEGGWNIMYDPTGTAPVLTFKGLELDYTSRYEEDEAAVILSAGGGVTQLRIELAKGSENSICFGHDDQYTYGIKVRDLDLEIAGSGSLEVTAAPPRGMTRGDEPEGYAIDVSGGELIVSCASLEAVCVSPRYELAVSTGIDCDEKLTVNNGAVLTATGSEAQTSHGMSIEGIEISGGARVTATGGNGRNGSYGVISTGDVILGGSSRLTATGGESGSSSPSMGINIDIHAMNVYDSAQVLATGGAARFSFGIYGGSKGSLLIQDSAAVTAKGGVSIEGKNWFIQNSAGVRGCRVTVCDSGTLIAKGSDVEGGGNYVESVGIDSDVAAEDSAVIKATAGTTKGGVAAGSVGLRGSLRLSGSASVEAVGKESVLGDWGGASFGLDCKSGNDQLDIADGYDGEFTAKGHAQAMYLNIGNPKEIDGFTEEATAEELEMLASTVYSPRPGQMVPYVAEDNDTYKWVHQNGVNQPMELDEHGQGAVVRRQGDNGEGGLAAIAGTVVPEATPEAEAEAEVNPDTSAFVWWALAWLLGLTG